MNSKRKVSFDTTEAEEYKAARHNFIPEYTAYLPIDLTDREGCANKWLRTKELGEGSFGKVYEACRADGDCKWVLKVSNIKSHKHLIAFQRDTYFMYALKDTGITPDIVDSWICGEFGYVVMDRWDGDVFQLVQRPNEDEATLPKWAMLAMVDVIFKLSDNYSIVHGDIKFENFLYREETRQVCLTDFGNAVDYTKEKGNLNKVDLGWHIKFACRHKEQYAPFYNLWNLELGIRMLMLEKYKIDYLTLVDDDGETYPFTHFGDIDDNTRSVFEDKCTLKMRFPPINKNIKFIPHHQSS